MALRNAMSVTTLVEGEFLDYVDAEYFDMQEEVNSREQVYECLEQGCQPRSAASEPRGQRFTTQDLCEDVCTEERWQARSKEGIPASIRGLDFDSQVRIVSSLLGITRDSDPLFFGEEYARYSTNKQRLAEAPSHELVGDIIVGIMRRASQHPGILFQLLELRAVVIPGATPRVYTDNHWSDAMAMIASFGMTNLLSQLRNNPRPCPLTHTCLTSALTSRHMETLLWLLSNGCEWPHYRVVWREIRTLAVQAGVEFIDVIRKYKPRDWSDISFIGGVIVDLTLDPEMFHEVFQYFLDIGDREILITGLWYTFVKARPHMFERVCRYIQNFTDQDAILMTQLRTRYPYDIEKIPTPYNVEDYIQKITFARNKYDEAWTWA